MKIKFLLMTKDILVTMFKALIFCTAIYIINLNGWLLKDIYTMSYQDFFYFFQYVCVFSFVFYIIPNCVKRKYLKRN